MGGSPGCRRRTGQCVGVGVEALHAGQVPWLCGLGLAAGHGVPWASGLARLPGCRGWMALLKAAWPSGRALKTVTAVAAAPSADLCHCCRCRCCLVQWELIQREGTLLEPIAQVGQRPWASGGLAGVGMGGAVLAGSGAGLNHFQDMVGPPTATRAATRGPGGPGGLLGVGARCGRGGRGGSDRAAAPRLGPPMAPILQPSLPPSRCPACPAAPVPGVQVCTGVWWWHRQDTDLHSSFFLQVMLRVGDLDKSIKFYTEVGLGSRV